MDFLEAAGTALRFKCHSSFDTLHQLRDEWDDFVQSVDGDIYLTFDWCAIWWDSYGRGRQLRVFEYRCNGVLVGLLPMFVETARLGPCWLRIAKIVGSDFTIAMVNLPIQDGHARVALNRTIHELVDVEKCDAIHFGPLAENYPAFEWLNESASDSDRVDVLRNHVQSPYSLFSLPESFAKYMESLDNRQRGNLRRGRNLVERELDFSVDLVTDEATIDHEFAQFIAMHTAQWKMEGKQGHFNDWPGAAEFNNKMAIAQAGRNRLRLLRFRGKNAVIAYEFCFAFGNRWFWRLPARLAGPDWDRYSLGRICLSKVLESAISEGAREVDGGAGHYHYKVRLGATEYSLHSVLLVRRAAFCRLRARLFLLLSDLLHFWYYRVWFIRLAPKLPFKRRPLWKIWIRTRI